MARRAHGAPAARLGSLPQPGPFCLRNGRKAERTRWATEGKGEGVSSQAARNATPLCRMLCHYYDTVILARPRTLVHAAGGKASEELWAVVSGRLLSQGYRFTVGGFGLIQLTCQKTQRRLSEKVRCRVTTDWPLRSCGQKSLPHARLSASARPPGRPARSEPSRSLLHSPRKRL